MSTSFHVAVMPYLEPLLSAVVETFAGWVQSVIDDKYQGVAGRLAKEIGVTLTTLSRGIETGTLGTDTLLRLALVTGRDASEVLRLADKGDWADLIEKNYGKAVPTSPVVRELMAIVEERDEIAQSALPVALAAQAALRGQLPVATEHPVDQAAGAETPRKRGAAKRRV